MFNYQDNEFDNTKLTNLDSITVKRNPNLGNELPNKKYVDDSIGEGTILRFSQPLENYLKVSVGNDVYNLSKHDKIRLNNVTEIRYPNKGDSLLRKKRIKHLNKNNALLLKNSATLGNFSKSTKTSPTSQSVATTLPPIRSAFMYTEKQYSWLKCFL